jgi:hypothetical protein
MPENNDALADSEAAYTLIKGYIPTIHSQFACIASHRTRSEEIRCAGLSPEKLLIPSVNYNNYVCRDANAAFRCLQGLPACGMSNPTYGQLIAEAYRVMTKSALRRLYGCVIVDAKNGASKRFDVIQNILLASVGASTFMTFIN